MRPPNGTAGQRLAVLDVEGIILPKRRYLLLQATRKVAFPRIVRLFLFGLLYELGIYTLERALRGIYALFAGISLAEVYATFKVLPIIPGAPQLVHRLKARGYRIALISSGLPGFLVDALAEQLRADHACGLTLDVVDGTITGRIGGAVLNVDGKAVVLERLFAEQGYQRRHSLVIADDRNNLSMFPLVAKTIGYNPDSLLAARCDYAVRGDLLDLLPFLETPVTTSRTPFTVRDAVREFIHMGGFAIPLLCRFALLDRSVVVALILATTVAYTSSELARRAGFAFPPFTRITKLAAVGEERWEFATAPIFFALGIALSLSLFPPQTAYTAITVLTLGDSTATIAGKRLGNTAFPYNKAKRIEGMATAILVSTLASLLFVPPTQALLVSTACMLVESLPIPVDDNLVLPLVAGVLLTMM